MEKQFVNLKLAREERDKNIRMYQEEQEKEQYNLSHQTQDTDSPSSENYGTREYQPKMLPQDFLNSLNFSDRNSFYGEMDNLSSHRNLERGQNNFKRYQNYNDYYTDAKSQEEIPQVPNTQSDLMEIVDDVNH